MGSGDPMAEEPQRNRVTLHDGRQVDSWSEEWRAECEARAVLAMPSIQRRREYLAGILKFRGQEAHDELAGLVRKIWQHNRRHE